MFAWDASHNLHKFSGGTHLHVRSAGMTMLLQLFLILPPLTQFHIGQMEPYIVSQLRPNRYRQKRKDPRMKLQSLQDPPEVRLRKHRL